jgi:uncharacterized SAM-binding protein YcdF (DUF218 family)
MGSEGVRKEASPALEQAATSGPVSVPLPPNGERKGGRRRWGRRLGLLLVVFVAGLLGLYASRGWVLPALARFLDVSEPAQATDYIMVMGGDAETRPFAAAAFLHAGLARKALLGRIMPSVDSQEGLVATEQELIRAVLVREGTAPDAIQVLPGPQCRSTFDEARALADFLAAEPQSTVTVVTSAYHTRRVRMIFRKVLGEKAARVHFLGAPGDGYTEDNWWCFEGGFLCYLNEYFKLAFYLVRY